VTVPVAGVLLAAGSSSRFGADKLLHRLPGGEVLAVRSARNLCAALPRSIAAVRDSRSELASLLQAAGLTVVACDRAADGMGASLACGVAASADAEGWVIALADMPFVRPDTIAAVAAALAQGAPIAAPVHDGRRGHPVGFSRRFLNDLLALSGDTGARRIVVAHADSTVLLNCGDAGVLRDIDLPDDLDPV
jgi:molybdenum cofactor cytidylyltransferase